jgi:hypothetical protein
VTRKREFDPLGRDALFLPPQTEPDRAARPRPTSTGRAALFSAPPRRRGDAVVECASCGAHTPVPKVELARTLLPSVFVPFRRHPHLMRCPACRRAAWCRVDWGAVLPA